MKSSRRNDADLRAVDWLGLHVEVPDEWEIVKHSTKFDRGALAFVDRRRHRMQLSWTGCATAPDVERILSDFRARDQVQEPGCELSETFRLNRWSGYRRNAGGLILTRAGCYDRHYRRWVDVAMPWPHGFEAEAERAVLGSFRIHTSESGELSLDAFDLAVTAPAVWRLGAAEVWPTRVSLTFDKRDAVAIVRRIAMPDAWFDGHVEHFLSRQALPIKGTCSLTRKGPHEAGLFEGRERVVHPRWLLGKRKERHDWAWECPIDHAVYHVVVTRYPGDSSEPTDFAVRCCRGVPRS